MRKIVLMSEKLNCILQDFKISLSIKKTQFLRVFLILAILAFLPIVRACANSVDYFALEVQFSKPGIDYDFGRFSHAGNYIVRDNNYIFQSQQNKNIATIISERKDRLCEECLNLRLQIPMETSTKKVPYFSFISSVSGKKVNMTKSNYKDWIAIFNANSQIELRKSNIYILLSSFSNRQDIIVEINEELASCEKCDGKCVSSFYGKNCIPKALKEEIESVLKNYDVINNFDELFWNYRVVGYGEKTVTDLYPSYEENINWKDALIKELEFLKDNKIVNLSEDDIKETGSLAERGKAGDNYRIVYSKNNLGEYKWQYYYETLNTELTDELNCEDFTSSIIPEEKMFFSKIGIPLYYLIPLVGIIILLIILAILFLIGRGIGKKK